MRQRRPSVARVRHPGRRPRGTLRGSLPGRRRRVRGAQRRHRRQGPVPRRLRRRGVRQEVQITIARSRRRGRPLRHHRRHLPRREQPDGGGDDRPEPRVHRGRRRRVGRRGRVRALQLLLRGQRRRRRYHPRNFLHALRRGRGVLGQGREGGDAAGDAAQGGGLWQEVRQAGGFLVQPPGGRIGAGGVGRGDGESSVRYFPRVVERGHGVDGRFGSQGDVTEQRNGPDARDVHRADREGRGRDRR
mmetsp:Transcript_3667/g.16810  ORF Transcript_3667/g.16810 Transcript_3667/m.16810 type:complete len:245 (+) Transcript_3667:367-1101(+)